VPHRLGQVKIVDCTRELTAGEVGVDDDGDLRLLRVRD
jgi:hypothetical protein